MSIFGKVLNFTERLAKNTVSASNDLRQLADEMDSEITEAARKAQQSSEGTGAAIEQTLRKNKFGTYGAKAGIWLANPMNLFFTVLGIGAAVWYIATLSKG